MEHIKKRIGYTQEEVEYLKTHYAEKGPKAISKIINKTPDTLKCKARRLGLRTRESPVMQKQKYNCFLCGIIFYRGKSREKGSKSKKFYCSKDCKNKDFRTKNKYKIEKVCVGCGEKKLYLLNLHHIDGNKKNDKENNLEMVCCNCHSIRHINIETMERNYRKLTPRHLIPQL